jgi:hypothetical protein
MDTKDIKAGINKTVDNTNRNKLFGERRKALLLKKAVLQQMIKQQADMHQAWIRRGR